jgi:cytochrome P450
MHAMTGAGAGSQEVLRPRAGGFASRLVQWAMQFLPTVFRLLRAFWPIIRAGSTVVVTRHDDVREVFLTDRSFSVAYQGKLDVIMGHEPFFLGMGDTPEYRRDTSAMRRAVKREDLAVRLKATVANTARARVAGAGGRIEVVDFVRQLTFEVLCDYFGVDQPAGGNLQVWATRLFEFQFADPSNDPSLRAEVDVIAPRLRAHIDSLIGARRAGSSGKDDVLGRCLALAAQGQDGFSDTQIRSALIGFVVGGLPQPPMVVPQALEQLLRRPAALAAAQHAAAANDDGLLAGFIFEALRFDPLAPALMRLATADHTIAEGTSRATRVGTGSTVLVAFSSAMMDGRRVAQPRCFNPLRPPHEYIHFGHGLHTCFGIHINQALLPLMIKPLLSRPALRRAAGSDGHLCKRGAFADRLWVEYN